MKSIINLDYCLAHPMTPARFLSAAIGCFFVMVLLYAANVSIICQQSKIKQKHLLRIDKAPGQKDALPTAFLAADSALLFC